MKIAHVMQWFELGGGESVALRLAEEQVARGRSVHAVGLCDGPLAEQFRRVGALTHILTKSRGFDVTMYAQLSSLFMRERFDVVHLHDEQSLVYGALPARSSGAQVVFTKHGDTPDTGRRMMLRRAAGLFVHRFIAVSETTAETARKQWEIVETKLRVIANGVDLRRYASDPATRANVRAELEIAADAVVIGTVGRQEPEKNPELLLRAAKPLLSRGAYVVFVGDGSLTDQLRHHVHTSPHGERIRLLGRRNDVARVMSAFDVFVLPSRTEGMPLVVLEAMATGLPVVATAVGGLATLVQDGTTGLLVPSEDEQALTDAVTQLVDDRALARNMGQKGCDFISGRYSLRAMVDAYDLVYRG